jgi:small subunit ribosomal protein S8
MNLTDPIADMLTRIRNANQVNHEMLDIPGSKVKAEIARLLKEEGYIRNYKILTDPKREYRKTIRVFMSYSSNRERVIQGLRRISKPGRRIYAGKAELPRVLGGLGVALISTSQGLMTDAEARRRGLGGEVLCYVW